MGGEGDGLQELAKSPKAAPAGRFFALDALRGVCAVMVVGFHLNAGGHLRALFANGYVGVDFFFVLSGFIIASAYGGKVRTWRDFASAGLRRLGRLYPLHLAALGVWLVFVIVTSIATGHSAFREKFDLESLGENLVLVQGFTVHAESWNYTAWSISLELWVNIAYFALAVVLGRRLIAAEIGLAAVLAGVGVTALLSEGDPSPQVAALISAAHYALGFLVGALLFRLHGRLKARGWRPPAWLTLLALVVGAAPFLAADQIADLAMIPLFAFVVLIFAFDVGPLAATLARGAWRRMGTVSYSIYLIHPFFTILTAMLILRLGKAVGRPAVIHDATGDVFILGGPWAMDLALAACIACVLFASGLTFRLIEDPARRYVNGLSRRWFG